jgi:hypothetical protein
MGMGLATTDVTRRSLYTFTNAVKYDPYEGGALDSESVRRRTLYTYVNASKHGHPIGGEPLDAEDLQRRSLYTYVNRAHGQEPSDVVRRSLYNVEAYTNDEIFPWIERIDPSEQFPGGQVNVHGDGFGDTEGQEGSSVRLGVYDPTQPGPGVAMGVVSWQSRSPNLHPANGDGSGANPPLTKSAITVTVPVDAESGMLSVEETT